MIVRLAAALLVLAPAAARRDEPAADAVELRNGRSLEGRVVYVDEDVLVLRQGSRDRELEREDVASYTSLAERHARIMARSKRVAPSDLLGNLGLAKEAQEHGLFELARLFFWRVLAAHPKDEAAHRGLGHRQRGERFVVPCSGRHYPMDQRARLAEDFDDGWELESTHYRLRSNLPLDRAVALTLDLERAYLEFFRLFGREWRLFEVLEPLVAHVHADEKSYPRQGREGGYFSRGDRVLRVDASRRVVSRLVVHEGVHQLIDATARRERVYRGSIPGWLDEGLAEYLGIAVTGATGAVSFEPGRLDEAHVARVLESRKGFDLSRVLTLSASDFSASSSGLRYSQSWSLVHFLLHGGEPGLRRGFHAFVRGCYAGKGSPTHLKKALGVKERDLEVRWEACLRGRSGR